MDFKPGQTYHLFKGPGKPYKIHIVAIVDECYVVYKWYGRHKPMWHYEVYRSDMLEYEIEMVQHVLKEED